MTVEELQIELDNLGVPQSFYSINGHLSADTYMLNQVYTYWEYFYFDERGNTRDYRKFEDEKDACKYLYEKFKNEMRYYYPPK